MLSLCCPFGVPCCPCGVQKSHLRVLPDVIEMSIDDSDQRVCVWESTTSLFFLFFQIMVDGVNSVPTNPYAAMPQLSGLAEVIVDAGKKATPHQATIGAD